MTEAEGPAGAAADTAAPAAPGTAADAVPGVGAELATARAALGLSIADVAQQLKFAARQIEAMEQDRFEALPSGTFARGMVRSYARLLKLDAEKLVGRMAARVAVPDNAKAVASTRRPIPITNSHRRGNLVYVGLSVAMLGVIVAVAFEWQRERSNEARLSFVPAAKRAEEPQRLASVAASASAVEMKPSDISASPVPVEAAAATPTPTPTPITTPAAASAPAAAGNRRILLKFEGDSWVQIKGRDGKTLHSQLNPSGSEQSVEGRPPFSLIIGNAQHVRLSYEDRQIDLAPHVKVEVARFTLE